jgi:hypothetical protein
MTANTHLSGKRGGKRQTSWKPGQSGNPAGRPKDGESWAAIIKSVGDMYPADIVAFIGKDNDLGRMLSKLPQGVQMKYLVTARVFAALMFEPTHGLWKETMERVDGKVKDQLDVTSNGEQIGNDGDFKREILSKLARIAESRNSESIS